jgi:hypothetical protein
MRVETTFLWMSDRLPQWDGQMFVLSYLSLLTVLSLLAGSPEVYLLV